MLKTLPNQPKEVRNLYQKSYRSTRIYSFAHSEQSKFNRFCDIGEYIQPTSVNLMELNKEVFYVRVRIKVYINNLSYMSSSPMFAHKERIM